MNYRKLNRKSSTILPTFGYAVLPSCLIMIAADEGVRIVRDANLQ
jgi:hypothetical protein